MIKVNCNTKDTLPIEALTEFQGELKHRDAGDVQKIIKSIKKHGFAFPFFVWKHDDINHVFDGHGRLLALKTLQNNGEEIPELPVVYVNAENENEAKEMLLKLNSNYGKMTQESVLEFLDGLQLDFEDLELPEGCIDFTKIIDEQDDIDEEEVPELSEEEPDSKPGMIYELGSHRLMCGNSCSPDDMNKLMNGQKADMICTDPPYNVDYEGSDGKKIQNDHMEDSNFLNFLVDAFNTMFGVLKNGGVYYIWHADSEGYNFRTAVKKCGGIVRQCLIWVKNSLVLGRQDYQWRHEPCLYGWKEGSGHYWDGRRDLSTVIDKKKDYKSMSKEQLLEEVKKLTGENLPQSIIYEDKPKKNDDHPTMKPVPLFVRLIRNSSKEEDIVLDPFGGFRNNFNCMC